MINEDSSRNFLGTGFKFPVQVDPNTGKVKTSSQDEDIKEAIRIILGTQPGERPMTPKFGCAINSFAFAAIDYTTVMTMKHEIEDSLTLWEPRIKDIRVDVDWGAQNSGMLIIEINYVVRSTNNPFNLVYPFYINEGYGEGAKV